MHHCKYSSSPWTLSGRPLGLSPVCLRRILALIAFADLSGRVSFTDCRGNLVRKREALTRSFLVLVYSKLHSNIVWDAAEIRKSYRHCDDADAQNQGVKSRYVQALKDMHWSTRSFDSCDFPSVISPRCFIEDEIRRAGGRKRRPNPLSPTVWQNMSHSGLNKLKTSFRARSASSDISPCVYHILENQLVIFFGRWGYDDFLYNPVIEDYRPRRIIARVRQTFKGR